MVPDSWMLVKSPNDVRTICSAGFIFLFWWYRSTLRCVYIRLFSHAYVWTINYKSNKKYTIVTIEHDYVELYQMTLFPTSQNSGLLWSLTFILYVWLICETQDWFIVHAQLYVVVHDSEGDERFRWMREKR
jgi:hypothetical protein